MGTWNDIRIATDVDSPVFAASEKHDVGLGLIGNATVPPTTLLIGKFFGNRKMPTLSGIAMVFHQIGSSISTYLGGVLFVKTGDYIIIWICGAIVAACAALLCYTIRERKAAEM